MDDEAMKAMARRICARISPAYDSKDMAVALAAIIETQELCAKIAKSVIYEARTGEIDNDLRCVGHILDSRLRSGQQFRKDV